MPWWSGGIAQSSFTSTIGRDEWRLLGLCLLTPDKNPLYRLDRKLSKPKILTWRCAVENNYLPQSGIESRPLSQ
jgi:hypothetical protein